MSIEYQPAVRNRPGPPSRRAGYVIAIAVDMAMIWLIDVWPGWAAVPVLTGEAIRVLPLINVSLLAGVAVNALYLASDPPWFLNLGGLVTTGIGVAVLARLWQVFPFAFSGTVDWALILRVVLVLGLAGSIVAIVVQLVRLVAALLRHPV